MSTERLQVYIGLGSNQGDPLAILRSAITHIIAIPHVYDVQLSSFYETPPISDIPQPNYINGVCRLTTVLDVDTLFSHLQNIEKMHGRISRHKDAPRTLDLDILFYAGKSYYNPRNGLEIPHPRWAQRLFVLIPLRDLTNTITFRQDSGDVTADITTLVESFPLAERNQITHISEVMQCTQFV